MVSPCSCTAVSSPCLWYAEIFTERESRYLTRSDFMAVLSLTVVTGGTFCNVDIILVFFFSGVICPGWVPVRFFQDHPLGEPEFRCVTNPQGL